MTGPIVTLTPNPALDLSTAIDEVVPHVKLRCEAPTFEPGGGGLNVARSVHSLGGSALALYTSGGPVGDWLGSLLDREGVPRSAFAVGDDSRESIALFDRSRGDQFRFLMPGPELGEDEWQRLLDALARLLPNAAEYVVASGSLPRGVPADFYARVAKLAARHDRKVVLDTSGPPLEAALEEGVFLINPNYREFDALGAWDADDTAAREAFAAELVHTGAAAVVAVTLGHRGAMAVSAAGALRVQPPRVEAVSGVGAGDGFTAGLTLGLTRGWPLDRALAYAAAAAAGTWMTPGSAVCRREDVDRLVDDVAVAAADQ